MQNNKGSSPMRTPKEKASDTNVFAIVVSGDNKIHINEAGYVIHHDGDKDSGLDKYLRLDLQAYAAWLGYWNQKPISLQDLSLHNQSNTNIQTSSPIKLSNLSFWDKTGHYEHVDYSKLEHDSIDFYSIMDGNIKTIVNHDTKELTITFGEQRSYHQDWEPVDSVTLPLTDEETWMYTRLNGIDLAIDIRHEDTMLVSIYAYDMTMRDIIATGKSSLNLLNLQDCVTPISETVIGKYDY